MEDCIPSPAAVEREIEKQELTGAINARLAPPPKNDRVLFVRRYWNGEATTALTREGGTSPAGLAKRMYRLRQNLKSTFHSKWG